MLQLIDKYNNALIQMSNINKELALQISSYPQPVTITRNNTISFTLFMTMMNCSNKSCVLLQSLNLKQEIYTSPSIFFSTYKCKNRLQYFYYFNIPFDIGYEIMNFFCSVKYIYHNNNVIKNLVNEISEISDINYDLFLFLKINLGDTCNHILLFYYKLKCLEKWNENEIKFFLYLPRQQQITIVNEYEKFINNTEKN